MASTFIDIANSALIRCGTKTISSFEDGSPEANACRQRWEQCRDLVLRMHPWNCAMKRAVLAPDSEAPSFGFGYQFSLPADFLRAFDVSDSPYGSDVRFGSRPPYKIESGKILFDSASLYLRYIWRVENAAQLDASCVEAISCYLAYDLCSVLSRNDQLKVQLQRDFNGMIAKAQNIDSQEEDGSMIIDFFERARMGP